MRLYAQHGAQVGDKVAEGFRRGLLDGVIYSPRDISRTNLQEQLVSISERYPAADLLLDSQYYTCLMASGEQVRLGYLPEDYADYFVSRRRMDLSHKEQIAEDMERVLRFQMGLGVTHLIAPNILISRSFDSREASLVIDFLIIADQCYRELHDQRPLYVTLAVSREALMDRGLLMDYMNEITALDISPSGFYLLVATSTAEARSEIFHEDVIAGWMYLNYVLTLNGFSVINGYSDLLTPFLGAAGAYAGATGWWSNLRAFSLDRFGASPGGGRLPTQRYLSIALMNRITFAELDILRQLMPIVLNGLPTDVLYTVEDGSEPMRNQEVLQSWDALRALNARSAGSIDFRLRACRELVSQAAANYETARLYHQFDQKSNNEHLPALIEAIRLFNELAELDLALE